MDVIETKHDGNCLFEALLRGLHLLHGGDRYGILDDDELERGKHLLRKEIADVVCVHCREQFAPFCPHPQRLYQDGEWAGDYEIVAFTQQYQTNVVLYDQNQQWETVHHFPSDELPYPTTLTLLRTDQAHYSLLWCPPPPPPDAPPPSVPPPAYDACCAERTESAEAPRRRRRWYHRLWLW